MRELAPGLERVAEPTGVGAQLVRPLLRNRGDRAGHPEHRGVLAELDQPVMMEPAQRVHRLARWDAQWGRERVQRHTAGRRGHRQQVAETAGDRDRGDPEQLGPDEIDIVAKQRPAITGTRRQPNELDSGGRHHWVRHGCVHAWLKVDHRATPRHPIWDWFTRSGHRRTRSGRRPGCSGVGQQDDRVARPKSAVPIGRTALSRSTRSGRGATPLLRASRNPSRSTQRVSHLSLPAAPIRPTRSGRRPGVRVSGFGSIG